MVAMLRRSDNSVNYSINSSKLLVSLYGRAALAGVGNASRTLGK